MMPKKMPILSRTRGPNTGDWQTRHANACDAPEGFERPIVDGLRAWLDYAYRHAIRYESEIGEDYFLGPAWQQWGLAMRVLLNGECGRLNCGTLDAVILDSLSIQGLEIEP